MSLVKQNFHTDCEKALNQLINLELYASYTYLSMAYHFDREDVALPGLSQYFKKASHVEYDHAMKCLTYQNKRGGRIVLTDIKSPAKSDWGTAKDVTNDALNLEMEVDQILLKLHISASIHDDPNLSDFIETEFLQEQVDLTKEIAYHATNL